jgi:transposase InsO family protein
MPWEERDAVTERTEFIVLVQEDDANFSAICRRFGIHRDTGYKWVSRFEAEGWEGLVDRPRAPKVIPHRTPALIEEAIVALRKKRPTWGPKKLRAVLMKENPEMPLPSHSTIGEILKRRGLVRPRRRRLRTAWTGGVLEGADAPNALWAIDFKGHFAMGNGARCHPLTVTDLYSRYLLKCEGLEREGVQLVKPQLELTFREFGLPWRLRSDNGGPFSSLAAGGLCELAVWLIQLGVTPERIRPSSPQENGSHERMHRTLKAEATRPPQNDLTAQQRVFDEFRAIFNRERPHEALGQRPPGSLYTNSARAFPAELKHPEYPSDFLVRRTAHGGSLTFKQEKIFLSKSLTYAPVGFKPVNDDRWQLFYGPLSLGFVDARNGIRFMREIPGSRRAPPLASLTSADAQ